MQSTGQSYQIFTLDSAVVEVQEMFSSHGGLLTNAKYHNTGIINMFQAVRILSCTADYRKKTKPDRNILINLDLIVSQ